MLSYKTIESDTLELLRGLMAEPLLAETRLVGGTALALQYGHRNSIDLEFFGKLPEDKDEEFREMLRHYGNVVILKEAKTIKCYLINGIKVDFVNYKYSWIDEMICDDSLILASPKDIAAMKINAVEGRGTKKDFVDIYFLLKKYTLNEILAFYELKYPEHSQFRALMSLSYFEDAEQQPIPKMFITAKWEDIKEAILQEITKLSSL